jgi:predicted PurR-regulated permease PerM
MGIDFSYDKRQISSVFLGVSFILIVLLLIYLIKPIKGALALTVVLTYILHSPIERILPLVKRRILAVAGAFFFVLIPFFVFSIVLITALVSQIIQVIQKPSIAAIIDDSQMSFLNLLSAPPMELLSVETIAQGLGAFIKFLGSIGGLFLQILLAIFFTAYVLYKEEEVIELSNSVKNPRTKDFILFVDEGLKQLVYSMFLTALVTGLIATTIYLLFGVPFAILLGTTTGVVALIPILGVWLVYFPVSLYYISQGQTFFGLVFLGICIAFVSVVPDMIVRPIQLSRGGKST